MPVYLSPSERILTIDGHLATASFFAPWEPDVEPYIRIATGDYASERTNRGRDNALASYLHSLAHEIVHYQQWVETGKMSERGVVARAGRMVTQYAKTVTLP